MSIRTNPFKAVPLLLRRLTTIEKHANLDDLKEVLMNIKDLFWIVKKNEEELLDTLTEVDDYVRNFNTRKLMEEKEEICKRIRNSTQKLLPAHGSSGKTFQVGEPERKEIVHQSEPSLKLPQELEMRMDVYLPSVQQIVFFNFLSALPQNSVLKKRQLIYWWFGSRSLNYEMHALTHGALDLERRVNQERKAAEDMFSFLLVKRLIVPHGNGKCPLVNKYKISPLLRDVREPSSDEDQVFRFYSQIKPSSHDTRNRCLALDQQKVKLSDELGFKFKRWTVIFNVSASYLDIGPQWMTGMKNLEMLHLGRCHDSASHHIEVESEEFLMELRDQKYLSYLSLRGISRISKLPPSILQLESLEILDLKACHNLETLPNDISSLRKLRHLDVSQCYLLERMPKGIENLTKLESLKGFLIGNPSKTPCRISDFANLSNLERLSIQIGSEAVIQDKEFESLKNLSKLTRLKISWGGSGTRYSDMRIFFPSSLFKLHLEGFSGEEIPEWLKPSMLPKGLKVLYITGGKLRSLAHGDNNNLWSVEIVRLKYLNHLKVDGFTDSEVLSDLQRFFPFLKYVEVKKIADHLDFEWIKVIN
ncbi:disease resistance RPP13-like protein 4 [Abrus precatorius]|uniref:Disease resistance RPP13-like protein 4 n=1 Tax=Abrus precatorius TaxID=3816 RepID=A0A8B8KB36_ABRPR|nr:disease resistance RPP13-like protein 4 [Abrus precatorius]